MKFRQINFWKSAIVVTKYKINLFFTNESKLIEAFAYDLETLVEYFVKLVVKMVRSKGK